MNNIHNKEIPITMFSEKPNEYPKFEIITPEPFQNEWPRIAINIPRNKDLGGIIFNLGREIVSELSAVFLTMKSPFIFILLGIKEVEIIKENVVFKVPNKLN